MLEDCNLQFFFLEISSLVDNLVMFILMENHGIQIWHYQVEGFLLHNLVLSHFWKLSSLRKLANLWDNIIHFDWRKLFYDWSDWWFFSLWVQAIKIERLDGWVFAVWVIALSQSTNCTWDVWIFWVLRDSIINFIILSKFYFLLLFTVIYCFLLLFHFWTFSWSISSTFGIWSILGLFELLGTGIFPSPYERVVVAP